MWIIGGGLFELMFGLIFVLVIGMFIYVIVSGLRQWNKNNHSPRLTVDAQVVAKRADVTRHHGTDHSAGHTTTWHYVTFQVDSGDRMELPVTGPEYGMLAEGDRGRLTFQGTRYLGFVRER